MPIQECTSGGKPGYKFGASGSCYTHDGTDAGKAAAKRKAVKQAIAIGGGKAPRDLEAAEPDLVADVTRELAGLETVDLDAVEILEANVRIHGVGSPPEGDLWTPDDLRAMAAAAQELEEAGEFRAPAKLGHGKQQTLLASGELPAAGWLSNQRVSDDGTKLLADVHAVPRKVADLIKAKAYRTRSAELSRIKSQKTGKTYDWVVSGLAWLGGKMPAVRTLDDIVALYEGDDAEHVFLQADDVEEPTLDELRDAVAQVGVDLAAAYVTDRARRADIRRDVPEKPKYTDEQRRTFAKATGLDEDKVTDELLDSLRTGVFPKEEPKPDPEKQLQADERFRSLEAKVDEEAKKRRELEQELGDERKRNFVEGLVKDGKIAPGDREKWEKRYERDAEQAREYAADLTVNEDWLREYGVDEGDVTDGDREADERAYEADATSRLGIPKGAVL